MRPATLPWSDLICAIDALGLLGWLALIALVLAAVEAAWKALTLPVSIRTDAFSWVAVPSDLPVSATPSYGHRDLRSAYPGALTRGVTSAALGLLLLVSAWAWWLDATRAPDRVRLGRRIILPEFPDAKPTELIEEVRSTGPAPLSPELQRLLERNIVPGAERNALVDSTFFELTQEEFARGLFVSEEGRGDGLAPIANAAETAVPHYEIGEEPPVELSLVEELPVLVTLPRPVYPQMARDAGTEGAVELLLLISPRGVVERVRILSSVPGLDDAAREAALAARFRPASWQGRPVRVWASLTVRFRLGDS